jgi:hypothetical protein
MAKGERREGRGRLSSIDMLPDEATPDVVWAFDQLRERAMHQNAILKELNARLADRGIAGISKSSWSRKAVRLALEWRKQDQGRAIIGELHKAIGTDAPTEATLVLGEMIKLRVFEALEGEGQSTKDLRLAGLTLNSVVKSQADTLAYQQARDAYNARLKQAAEAIANEGAKAGIAPNALERITNLLTTGVG